ncbi:hypothetical protein V1291_004863 [Nitrobacteraceae bacterium AZCC 1564]
MASVCRKGIGSATRAAPRRPAASSSIEVVLRPALADCAKWSDAFATQRKDHRYYELVEDTLHPNFHHRYFVIKDGTGRPCAVQPFFVVDQDLVAGCGRRVKSIVDIVRGLWPRFMYMRTLMVGCAAGEGQLDGEDESVQRFCAPLLVPATLRQARAEKAGLIVLKEFPASYRKTLRCFQQHGFIRLPGLPMTCLNIEYESFGHYIERALSRAARKDLRRKFRATARAPPIEMSVLTDISLIVDEVYPLYIQVYNRSHLRFEKLTTEFLRELGRRMPDKTRFFIWRQCGRIVAMSICMVQGDTLHDEYIGLDYSVALDLHLYHYTFRDIITWAIANGYKRYRSNGPNYDPKLHLKFQLEPLDLYVRHTSPAIHFVMKFVLPWLEPTRYDKVLRHFSTYRELWDGP